jgi:hypothetical protein
MKWVIGRQSASKDENRGMMRFDFLCVFEELASLGFGIPMG